MDIDIERERMYPTPYADSPWLPLLLLSLMLQKHAPDVKTRFRPSYDFVVVGAGSAGSVIASRLSELHCVSVLLLEAGLSPPILTEIPSMAPCFIKTDVDWQFLTEPQLRTGSAYINRQIPYPRGKMLGGSSTLNGMEYTRGNRRDYDGWSASGAKGWSYKEVLPYFKKMEGNVDQEFVDNGYHGVGGPLTVSKLRYESELKEPIFEAYRKLGYWTIDPNGPSQTGTYNVQTTVRRGQRCSTAKAYLVPSQDRPNLDILTGAYVTRLVIENNRAIGVLFDFQGDRHFVEASREVILSAGAINSPQLLMLSGIGPEEHLREMNIPVVANLRVGENLQDHPGIYNNFELDSSLQTIGEKLKDIRNILTYIYKKSGPLASIDVKVLSYPNDALSDPYLDFPPLQLGFLDMSSDGAKRLFGLKSKVYEQVYEPYENKTIYACFSGVLHSQSQGTIKLKSTDPYDPPRIDPNYFEHPDDFEHLIEGMKICHTIGTSQPMKRLGSKPFRTMYPGCEHVFNDKDKYFRCQARMATTTNYHPVGTVKMGDPSDPTVVVDPKLRVKGIECLRVVDASIMPTIVSATPNVPTIMIAEKASDMIKEDIVCDFDFDDETGVP